MADELATYQDAKNKNFNVGNNTLNEFITKGDFGPLGITPTPEDLGDYTETEFVAIKDVILPPSIVQNFHLDIPFGTPSYYRYSFVREGTIPTWGHSNMNDYMLRPGLNIINLPFDCFRSDLGQMGTADIGDFVRLYRNTGDSWNLLTTFTVHAGAVVRILE